MIPEILRLEMSAENIEVTATTQPSESEQQPKPLAEEQPNSTISVESGDNTKKQDSIEHAKNTSEDKESSNKVSGVTIDSGSNGSTATQPHDGLNGKCSDHEERKESIDKGSSVTDSDSSTASNSHEEPNGHSSDPSMAAIRIVEIIKGQNDEDSDDDDDPKKYQNINPLNRTQDLEMDVIQNAYRASETDINDSTSDTQDAAHDGESSPPKRTTMFQSVPLPDDFLLSATLAIRTSILAGDPKDRALDATDFKCSRKYRISMAGDKKSQIKDFAPVVFHNIRKRYGISMQSYLMSWSDDRLAKEKTKGKSDALFVHSPDRRFIMKTIPKSEAKRLRKLLHAYYKHLEDHPDSLLSKIFGLHRVDRRRGLPKVYFAIFNNVFETQTDTFTEIYDLKGSSVGRRASEGENVMKDLDLGGKMRIHLPSTLKKKILEQITTDCEFLSKHRLMDYSLLVGVRHYSSEDELKRSGGIPKPCDPEQKLPGLLFFLESTKLEGPVAKDAAVKEKQHRRKSMTIGKPEFATLDDLKEDEEYLAVVANTEQNMSLSAIDDEDSSDTNLSISTDSVSSPDHHVADGSSETNNNNNNNNKDDNDSVKSGSSTSSKVPRFKAHSDLNIPASRSSSRDNSRSSSPNPEPSLKPALRRDPSKKMFQLVASTSAPLLNVLKNTDEEQHHTPFYQRDEGGLRSMWLNDEKEQSSKYFEIYHFGIIDFLQRYNKKKKLANFAKSLKYQKEELSTVEPSYYMTRFIKMAEKVVGS